MSAPCSERITLEFEPGEPIQGRVLDDGGVAHTFHGWLELCGVIDRAWQRTSAGVDPGPEDRGGRPPGAEE